MTIFYLLTSFVCLCYAILMILYLIGWNKTRAVKLPTLHSPLSTHVSIILPVRNEEKNILNILQHFSKQNYPKDKFEIIVADDFSTDKTSEFIMQLHIPNLTLIRLSNGEGKKKAIAEGISQASGALIVTTDADCSMNANWLSAIVAFYEEHKPKMIIAPVLLEEKEAPPPPKGGNTRGTSARPPPLEGWGAFQSQELMALTASACASIHYNLPILCSGANLAYEKDAFLAVNGFEGVDKTATGDDVFLMLKFYKKFPKEINYLKSKEAIVFTRSEKSLSDALSQRKRWASKSFSYGFSHVTWIALLIFFTNFLIFLSGILSIINIKFAIVLITCFLTKFSVDFMLLYSAVLFFGPTKSPDVSGCYQRKKLHLLVFLIASLVYPVYVSMIGLIYPFSQYSWKGRQL